jgi:hypothetical protein
MSAGVKDELYAVDIRSGLTGAAVRYQDWTLDKVGNWPYFFYDDSATVQTRLHSAANEITGRQRPYVNMTEFGET